MGKLRQKDLPPSEMLKAEVLGRTTVTQAVLPESFLGSVLSVFFRLNKKVYTDEI